MKTVKTPMSDETYATLVDMRKAEGVPSIAALFLKKCGLLDDDQEADEIVTKAGRKAQKLESGTVFTLKSLFPPEQWEMFSKGARLRAGKRFYDHILAKGFRDAKKTSSNHQLYKKP